MQIIPYLPPPYGGQRLSVPCQLMVHAVDLLEVSPIAMQQTFHYYYFDFASKKPWSGTVLTKRKNLTTPQNLRNLRGAFPSLPNGGHHFSYFGGIDRIINKMLSIVDGNAFVEQSGGKFIERQHLESVMKTGKDLYGRTGIPEEQFYPYDISNIKLPYLSEFVKKYPQFLRPKD